MLTTQVKKWAGITSRGLHRPQRRFLCPHRRGLP